MQTMNLASAGMCGTIAVTSQHRKRSEIERVSEQITGNVALDRTRGSNGPVCVYICMLACAYVIWPASRPTLNGQVIRSLPFACAQNSRRVAPTCHFWPGEVPRSLGSFTAGGSSSIAPTSNNHHHTRQTLRLLVSGSGPYKVVLMQCVRTGDSYARSAARGLARPGKWKGTRRT